MGLNMLNIQCRCATKFTSLNFQDSGIMLIDFIGKEEDRPLFLSILCYLLLHHSAKIGELVSEPIVPKPVELHACLLIFPIGLLMYISAFLLSLPIRHMFSLFTILYWIVTWYPNKQGDEFTALIINIFLFGGR